MTQRRSLAMQAVQTAKTPLPKWVSIAGLILVNLGTFGRDSIVVTFGGGSFGEWAANAIPILGAVLSTLSHSLAGDGGALERSMQARENALERPDA